jgi:hypothetical protein
MEASRYSVDVLTTELRRLRRENLKLKMHMQVIVSNPETRTSQKLRDKYEVEPDFGSSVLHMN